MRSLVAAAVISAACATACGDQVAQSPPDAAEPRPPDAAPPIDHDGDGHPAGADCDDGDAAVWQLLAYSFRDADGDQHVTPAQGTICSGATLPAGYTTDGGELDCDDSDPAVFASVTGFVDSDGDGVGEGAALALCTGGTLPAGYAPVTGDCAE